MNEKVGNMAFPMPQDNEPAFDKPYSEATAQMIDEEARSLVSKVRDRWCLHFHEDLFGLQYT